MHMPITCDEHYELTHLEFVDVQRVAALVSFIHLFSLMKLGPGTQPFASGVLFWCSFTKGKKMQRKVSSYVPISNALDFL